MQIDTTEIRSETPHAARPPGHERRRPGWDEFRRAYPGILATMGIAVLALIGLNTWVLYKRAAYKQEIERLRAGMTDAERRQVDLALAADENRFRVMVALVRRQAAVDKDLHLAVAVDSGRMDLEREGALLRTMRIQVGPEQTVGVAPDTVRMAIPRGTRHVERILGPGDAWEVPRWVYVQRGLTPPENRTLKGALGPLAVVLNGGTVVYSMPSVGPLNDSAYVLPGSVRASAEDLRAIAPNLTAGMKVYFY